jgi:hypothetical protein
MLQLSHDDDSTGLIRPSTRHASTDLYSVVPDYLGAGLDGAILQVCQNGSRITYIPFLVNDYSLAVMNISRSISGRVAIIRRPASVSASIYTGVQRYSETVLAQHSGGEKNGTDLRLGCNDCRLGSWCQLRKGSLNFESYR